jgi:hypothetical protein
MLGTKRYCRHIELRLASGGAGVLGLTILSFNLAEVELHLLIQPSLRDSLYSIRSYFDPFQLQKAPLTATPRRLTFSRWRAGGVSQGG